MTNYRFQNLPGRARAWLRSHRPFAWMDGFESDYCDWSPEGPIYERLIR